MIGTCHCGQVTITLAAKPDYVNFCDCSFCSKNGGAWGYFATDEVSVMGDTGTYMRGDIPDPVVIMHSCTTCYATTHWTLPKESRQDRMGVNIRIFDPADCEGVEARFLDGRNWFGDTEPTQRKPNERICAANFN